jgi:hypothetical protein
MMPPAEVSHHVIISGTGRAGTTFLVQLFTRLGVDTGFRDPWTGLYANADAGLEWDLDASHLPYVLKTPFLCDVLDELIDERSVVIDHAILPIRDLYATAESRRDVTRRTDTSSGGPLVLVDGQLSVPGGVWPSSVADEPQESVLARKLYALLEALVRRDIPTTLLHFPRLVRDARYLHRKLEPVLAGTSYDDFERAFHEVARPELVHDFHPPQSET